MGVTGGGDGWAEQTAVDTDSVDVTGYRATEADHDGASEAVVADTTGDGVPDIWIIERDRDGMTDDIEGDAYGGTLPDTVVPSSRVDTVMGPHTRSGTTNGGGAIGGSTWTAEPSIPGSGTSDPSRPEGDDDGVRDRFGSWPARESRA